jgi:hypothetical protein
MPAPVRRAPRLALLVAGVALLTAAPTARAADPPKPAETALGKVPADADYFRSALRLGETVEIIGKTRAWQQLWNDPTVRELWKKVRASYDAGEGDWAPLKQFFADPANAELPALVADALSNEVFVYAGAGTGDILALLQEAGGGAQYGPLFQGLFGGGKVEPDRARVRGALLALAEKPERLRVPDVVVGFKVSDPRKVATQLRRLDPLVAAASKDTPLAGRSQRVKVAGDDFLVLALDGSLVPWDDIPIAQYEEKEGEFAPLLTRLKAMKMTVSVGVREGYLLVAVGESADRLTRFGGDAPKLAGRPELKPLAKAAGRPLTAVGYASAALRQAMATKPEDVTGLADLGKALLPFAGLPDDLQTAIAKDLDALAAAIARGITKPGASAHFSVRTARGWETFDYDYTDPGRAPQRPLTLLNHLGGDPLLAAVWRSDTTVEDYRAFVKWVTVFAGHLEKVLVAKELAPEESVKAYHKEVLPLLRELSDVTEKLWLPALEDGQEAIVLDAKWASKRWHARMPEADRPLPLPELGIVVGVSDAAKLEQALEGYRTVLNKMIAKARELSPPGSVPEFEIPKPRVERAGGGTFAYYPIPTEWGIDKQFQPIGGLSDKVAVLALSRRHAERLLTATPLKTGLVPLADTTRPLDSVFYFNWAATVDVAGPWVDYAVRQAGVEGEEVGQVARKVMAVLKLFRADGSATYREGGATVTHSEAVFADIEPDM